MIKNGFPVYDVSSLSEFKQEGILISRFAPFLSIHKNLCAAHKHSFYHMVFFTKGGGTHTIDFQNFAVKPYQIYFMAPGQVHSWQFEREVDGYVVNFSVHFLQSLLLKPDYLEQFPFFNGSVNDAVIDLPEQLQGKVLGLFEQLLNESETAGRLSTDMVSALLIQLFILVGRLSFNQSASQPNSHHYLLLRNFQNLIAKNYSTIRLPKDYAALLFITPNHLNALCNRTLGLSAGEVIRNRILLEAKRLLINPSLTISEVAYQLNFADNSYFSKFYKKQTGMTPDEFRKENLLKTKVF